MKKKLKISSVVFVLFVAFLIMFLFNGLSPDVEYKVIDEKDMMTNALYVKVKTSERDENQLKIVMNSVKERYEEKKIDAIWLLIVDDSDEKFGKHLANAQIAYSKNGKSIIASGNKDYIFKMEKLQ